MKKKRKNAIVFRKVDLCELGKILNKAEEINTTYNVYAKYLSQDTKKEIRQYHATLKILSKQCRKIYRLASRDYYNSKKSKGDER